MKNIILALTMVSLLFVACSSSDDLPASADFDYNLELLYGEWRATSVESIGSQDLTTPVNELYATPTYLKFNKDGTLEGEGMFGEGVGKYSTKEKAIYTSISGIKKSFNVISLQGSTAKVKLNAKGLETPIIPDNAGVVTFTLTKNYPRTVNFDYNISSLYGKWRAVTLEVEGFEEPVDLTSPFATPTYLTFEEKGNFAAEGYFGDGTGRYSTENKRVYTLINKRRLDFDVTALTNSNAQIKINPQDVDFGITIPSNIDEITVVLRKQQ